MTETQTYAWIFLTINETPCSLQEIIAAADGINHAIPSQHELQHSLGWLNDQGLIVKIGKKYALTTTGALLRQQISASTIMRSWDNATNELAKMSGDTHPDKDVTPQEATKAYQGYKKWFWQTYRKIKQKDAQPAPPAGRGEAPRP